MGGNLCALRCTLRIRTNKLFNIYAARSTRRAALRNGKKSRRETMKGNTLLKMKSFL
jgi:hypothetical protein